MLKKIELILAEFKKCRKNWGLDFAMKKVIYPTFLNKLQMKHMVVLAYLKEKYAVVIDKYSHCTIPDTRIQPDSPIWVCWLQGEGQMPPLVKWCYESVKAHSGSHPLNLVTMDNYTRYVTIPDYIIEKLMGGGFRILTSATFCVTICLPTTVEYGLMPQYF